MNNDQIREIFIANGFTVKEGQTDLKPYVYEAARALLEAALKPGEPVAWVDGRWYEDGTRAGNTLVWSGRRAEDDFPVGTQLYTAAPPRREPPWIKTSEQYPPEGVRVFWFNPHFNQVGYDTWMGGDYLFAAKYWMHIPGIGGKE